MFCTFGSGYSDLVRQLDLGGNVKLERSPSWEGVEEQDHSQGYFHHRSPQGSKNQEHHQEQGWVRRDHTEWELFGAPIRCLLAQAELPQSRWLGGCHITLPVPGDFHSAGGDSPQPHTASEQTQEELAADTGSEHHLQLSRNPKPFTLSPLQGWTPPTTALSHT